jgi:hypothetical protein
MPLACCLLSSQTGYRSSQTGSRPTSPEAVETILYTTKRRLQREEMENAALRSRWRTGDRRCLPRKGSTGISDWLTVIIGDNWLDGHSSVVIGGYLALPSSRQVGRHSMIWPPFCRQIELVSICAYFRELDTLRALDAPDWRRMRGSALRVWRAQSRPSRRSWPALGAAERRRGAASTGGRCSTNG